MLILVSGKAGAGKDTFAKIIRNNYRGKKLILLTSFASELKSIAKYSFDWNGEKDEKGRQLLIDLGTSARAYDKDFWIKKVDNHYHNEIMSDDCVVIITDCRYLNEANYFPKDRTLKVRIESKRKRENPLNGKQKQDDSETELDHYDGFDYVIHNNGSMQEFEQVVLNFLGFDLREEWKL